jgi:hypothetical protein
MGNAGNPTSPPSDRDVDHEQLAKLWRDLSLLFTDLPGEDGPRYEHAFNEVVAVAVTFATRMLPEAKEEPEPAAISAAEPLCDDDGRGAVAPAATIRVEEADAQGAGVGPEEEAGGDLHEAGLSLVSTTAAGLLAAPEQNRPRTGSLFSRSSVESQEANCQSESMTFQVFRAAVLSQPLLVDYFQAHFPLGSAQAETLAIVGKQRGRPRSSSRPKAALK